METYEPSNQTRSRGSKYAGYPWSTILSGKPVVLDTNDVVGLSKVFTDAARREALTRNLDITVQWNKTRTAVMVQSFPRGSDAVPVLPPFKGSV